MRAHGRTGGALRQHLRSHVATYWCCVEQSEISALNELDGDSKALIQVWGWKKRQRRET